MIHPTCLEAVLNNYTMDCVEAEEEVEAEEGSVVGMIHVVVAVVGPIDVLHKQK